MLGARMRLSIAASMCAGSVTLAAVYRSSPAHASECTVTVSGSQQVDALTVPAGETWCFDPSTTTTLESLGNVVVEGTLEMKPASAAVVHTLRFSGSDENAFVGGGMGPVASDVGLWVVGDGRLDLQGSPTESWNRTGSSDTWTGEEELRVAPTAPLDYGAEGFATFSANAPVPSVVSEAGTWQAEVLNLSRNVRIEGVPPAQEYPRSDDGARLGRAHVFIHSTQPQTIRFVALRYMGPRQYDAEARVSESVLGRYALHFHMMDELSRGSIVEGVVVRDSGSHSFVPHGSDGISFIDTISYDTSEDAYWWDPRPRPKSPDASNDSSDTVFFRCVAALVNDDQRSSEQRMSGFRLGTGSGNSVTGSVAVGVLGRGRSSGFHWPEVAAGGVWTFHDNVAHNNRNDGIFVWQNNHDAHDVIRFTAYRNGGNGIEHGAYFNGYSYGTVDSFQNGLAQARRAAILVHAVARGSRALRFEDLRLDGGGTTRPAVLIGRHRFAGTTPATLRNVDVVGFDGPIVAVEEAMGQPGRYDFVCWTVADGEELEPSDFSVSSMHPESVIRLQRGDGTAYRVEATGAATPIPSFATC